LNRSEGWRGPRTTHGGTEVVHGGRDEAAQNKEHQNALLEEIVRGDAKACLRAAG